MSTRVRSYAFTINNWKYDEVLMLRKLADGLELSKDSKLFTPNDCDDIGESDDLEEELTLLGPKAKKAKKNACTLADVVVTQEKGSIQYLVFGREIGEKCKTPHLQCFIYFKNGKSWTAVRDLLPPRASKISARYKKSTDERAAGYCLKDKDYEQYGELPAQGKRTDLHELAEMVAEGKSKRDLAMHNPTQYIVHNRGLECLRRALRVDPVTMDGELDNYWYVGSTGVGKSKAVRDKYPDLYLKMKNKWWDNYEDQETVLIEEWTKEYEMLGDMLLQWSDRYPVQVEYKGSSMVIRPKRIVVTSNFTIEECFIFGKVDVNAIIRRFKVIKM